MSDNYSVFELLDDLALQKARAVAVAKIATMPDTEKYFLLGLLRHEEAEHGQAGVESVIAWLANCGEE